MSAAIDEAYRLLRDHQAQIAAPESIVHRQVAADPDGIREGLQMLRRGGVAILRELARKVFGATYGQIEHAGVVPGSRGDVGQDEIFEGVDPVGQRDGHAVPPVGGGFADDPEAIAARMHAHRLSGEVK